MSEYCTRGSGDNTRGNILEEKSRYLVLDESVLWCALYEYVVVCVVVCVCLCVWLCFIVTDEKKHTRIPIRSLLVGKLDPRSKVGGTMKQ
jgi:hypothetical protein